MSIYHYFSTILVGLAVSVILSESINSSDFPAKKHWLTQELGKSKHDVCMWSVQRVNHTHTHIYSIHTFHIHIPYSHNYTQLSYYSYTLYIHTRNSLSLLYYLLSYAPTTHPFPLLPFFKQPSATHRFLYPSLPSAQTHAATRFLKGSASFT